MCRRVLLCRTVCTVCVCVCVCVCVVNKLMCSTGTALIAEVAVTDKSICIMMDQKQLNTKLPPKTVGCFQWDPDIQSASKFKSEIKTEKEAGDFLRIMLEGYSDRQKNKSKNPCSHNLERQERRKKKQWQRTDEGRLRIAVSGGAAPAAGIWSLVVVW